MAKLKASIKDINLPPVQRPATKAVHTPIYVKRQIATFGDERVRSRAMAKARARRAGKAEKRHDEIAKLARDGLGDEQIAEITGYRRDSVRKIINNLRKEGVEIPHRKRGKKKCAESQE